MDVTFSKSEYFYSSFPSPSDPQGERENTRRDQGDLRWLEILDNGSRQETAKNEINGSQQETAKNEINGPRQEIAEYVTELQPLHV
ncbi:hypothetical protein ACFX19_009257 [Malus domestica]